MVILTVTSVECASLISSPIFSVSTGQSSAGIAWGIIVALGLVAVIIFISLYFRRRVRNLKTEIAHVQYIADPPSQPDRHHFDNPVYAFQPSTSSNSDSSTLLNNLRTSHKPSNLSSRGTRIFSCLKFVFSVELRRDRFTSSLNIVVFFAAGAYSVEYNTDMLQKNLNADMTNPNVYHSIDENFEDHVYDEIKQKDGYNPGECIERISIKK